MAKIKTIAKQVEEAAVLLQKLVRMKAANNDGYCECYTCGRRDHWTNLQGGHFISRKWISTKLLEENIKPQCPCCNGPLRGNMINYTVNMINEHGQEFVEELNQLKHTPKKYYKNEIDELKKELKERIAEQEKRLGI